MNDTILVAITGMILGAIIFYSGYKKGLKDGVVERMKIIKEHNDK